MDKSKPRGDHVRNVRLCHGLFRKKNKKKNRTIAWGWADCWLNRKWMNGWMLKAKMVQKACGDWTLDKPRWEEWWTVAQASAALILNFLNYYFQHTYLSLLFFLFFCIQTKTKQRINWKVLSSAATGEIWLMSQRTLIPRCVFFRSPAVPTSVVSYGRKLSAQADCDVGVERPPGH